MDIEKTLKELQREKEQIQYLIRLLERLTGTELQRRGGGVADTRAQLFDFWARMKQSEKLGWIVTGIHVTELAIALVNLSIEERGVAAGPGQAVQEAIHLGSQLR